MKHQLSLVFPNIPVYVCGCVQVVQGHQQNPGFLTVLSGSTVIRFRCCKLPFCHSPVYAEEDEERREQASLPHPTQDQVLEDWHYIPW